MLSIQVGIDVPQPREEVFAFLDVMANHIGFTDHMLHDWQLSGPASGVGSKASVTTKAGGRTDHVEIEVTAAEAPRTIVERNVGAGGKREATGTYTLEELPGGGTRIGFQWACQRAPLSERLLAPMIAGYLRKQNQTAMERLSERLGAAAS